MGSGQGDTGHAESVDNVRGREGRPRRRVWFGFPLAGEPEAGWKPAVPGGICRRESGAMKKMAPKVGLEPTTDRLTADCSTIELLWIPKGLEG